MIDLNKVIVFRDGMTLDNGVWDLNERTLGNAGYQCELGRKFGLVLDKFEIDDDMIVFTWIGTKRDVLRFYTYYSKNMTSESLETRKAVQRIILAKLLCKGKDSVVTVESFLFFRAINIPYYGRKNYSRT